MLIDEATALSGEIARVERLTQNAGEAQIFANRADTLEGPALELTALAKVLSLLRAHDVVTTFSGDQAAALLTRVRDVGARFAADPVSITHADPALRYNFWNPLPVFVKSLRDALQRDWSHHVASQLPIVDPELLEVLEGFPSFRVQVLRVRELVSGARSLEKQLPETAEEVASLEVVGRELARAWRELEGDGIPRDVLAFLKTAATVGAPLVVYTPAVQRWVIEHGLGETLTISLGRRRV